MAKTKPKVGRPPTEFDQAIADEICERIANGESLRKITLEERMPSQSVIFRWLANDDYLKFRQQYARAREAFADAIFNEVIDIADSARKDYNRDKLRIDTRKWMAGRLAPKKYGDRVAVEHGGSLRLEDAILESTKESETK